VSGPRKVISLHGAVKPAAVVNPILLIRSWLTAKLSQQSFARGDECPAVRLDDVALVPARIPASRSAQNALPVKKTMGVVLSARRITSQKVTPPAEALLDKEESSGDEAHDIIPQSSGDDEAAARQK
jgi:hypothetical protein